MSLTQQVRADLSTAAASRTLRIAAPLIAGAAALVTLGLAVTYGTNTQVADLSTPWGQGEVLVDPLTGLFLAAVLASFWGAAHRDGAILWHYLAGERRWHVVASAITVGALVGVLVGVVATAAKIGTLVASLPDGVSASWWESSHGTWAVGGAVFAAGTLAVTATCLAFVLRNGAAALGVVFGWILLVEPLVVSLVPSEWRAWFPGHAMIAVRNHVESVVTTQALATSLAYTALLVVGTVLLVQRRDPA